MQFCLFWYKFGKILLPLQNKLKLRPIPIFMRISHHGLHYDFNIKNAETLYKYYKINPMSKNIINYTYLKHIHLTKIVNNHFHTTKRLQSEHDSGIPAWLRDIANEIPEELQENLFCDELEDKSYFVMENEIVNFFLARAISYEELESSFRVSCPSCEEESFSHYLFIDKKSGFCVCPGCLWEGCWEDFIELLNTKEHSLNEKQLKDIIQSSTLLEESHEPLFISFPFNLAFEKLQEIECRISEDRSQAYIPIKGEDGSPVGVASISLLHPNPQIFVRIMEGKQGIFSSFQILKKTTKKIVLVSNVMSSLKLAKLKIPSIVLLGDHNNSSFKWAFHYFRNIILWLEKDIVSNELLNFLISKNISCYLVRASLDQEICLLSSKKVISLLAEAIPLAMNSIIMFCDIENEVYRRLINKEQIYGTQWTRFKELNHFLLGHRHGELTVLSGPTGSGKTTFMSEYSLDLCMQGVSTLWGSFEISVPRLCEIMLQQFSGSPLSENYSEFKILASKFGELPLYFFNNHGQQPIQEVIDIMTKAVLLKGVRHVVIDNLQFMLGFNGSNLDWWLEQDRAVGAFRQFATSFNCHVTLIVHPRKLALGEKLNMNTISGGARVTQEADNVILLQVGENKDGSKNSLGPKTLQIVKNRYGGTLGELKLRFHKDSLTLSSCFSTKSRDPNSAKSFKEGLDSLAASKDITSPHRDSW